MEFARCSDALYYDLLKVPHGHIPAPMVKFWSWLPVPVRGKRTPRTFMCPRCGMPSFFKVQFSCSWCADFQDMPNYDYKRVRRREKWRARWKQLEYVLLPFLVLFGKAWYMRSTRYHAVDYQRDRVPTWYPEVLRYRQSSLTDSS